MARSPEVPRIDGLPQELGGFLAVDRYGGILGVDRVFAAGDATTFPVKQGGLATQQADCAARAVAALAGAAVEPQPFQPILRGALLTEWGPRYLRAQLGARFGEASGDVAAKSVLWWPPAKVAGRYLAPYLVKRAGYRARKHPPSRGRDIGAPLTDLEPPPGDDAGDVASGHEDTVELALSFADANARWRDFRGAVRWLEVAEDLELYLPREYEIKRGAWQELAESS